MSEANENPFERYDLDPLEGIAGITERMRERIRDAKSEEERRAIRADWVALTKDPRERLALCLGAHPESRRPLPRGHASKVQPPPPSPLSPQELLPFVSYSACFGEDERPIDTTASWTEDPLLAPTKPPPRRAANIAQTNEKNGQG